MKNFALDLRGKVLAAGGLLGSLCEKQPGAGLCWTQLLQLTPVDSLQDTAGPISHVGGAPGKMFLRKGKTLHSNVRSEKKKCENYRGSFVVSEEGRGGGGPGARAGIPLQPAERTTLQQISPLQTMEDPMPEQMDIACRKLQLVESPCRSRFS